MQKKWVLVTGGAGFIGSHVNKMLHLAGYETVVLDNLIRGNRKAVKNGVFIEGNVGDSTTLDSIFKSYPISAVMHFAALTDVGESVQDPLRYYQNNLANTLTLLDSMRRNGIKVFIFSSTAAIFGLPREKQITESHPCLPINPYGQSKLMVETTLQDCDRAYGIRACCLRYFNAAGGDPDGEIKNYKAKESNLIPIILRSLGKTEGAVTVFGTDYSTTDGTCIRDYIHVEDLARAHILAMEKLLNGAPSSQYNLGNGHGFSVREVIAAVEKVTAQHIKVIEGPRRPGDPPVLVASSEKAQRELNWHPQYPSLEDMIAHAWLAIKPE